jgi:hypothetical protein
MTGGITSIQPERAQSFALVAFDGLARAPVNLVLACDDYTSILKPYAKVSRK